MHTVSEDSVRSSSGRTALFRLYLRLSAWLVPSFLVCAVLGLTTLANLAVRDIDRQLSARVGNFSARVASGLEQLARRADRPLTEQASQQLLLTLLADPAVECAELRASDGAVRLKAPQGLGCHAGVSPLTLEIPLRSAADGTLVVHWNRAEVAAARQNQRDVSVIILVSGLVIAMLTNWVAFRTIIGRPLNDLVNRVEQAKERAERNALHDSLTGLANRRKLSAELALRAALRQQLTVLHVDLDGFKTVNDTMGHAAGDTVLREIAKRLAAGAAEGEMVARNGGDEFMLLLPPGKGLKHAKSRAQAIIEAVAREVAVEGEACCVGASVGIATGRPNGREEQAQRIVANADIALYRAKARGRGVFVIYESEMRAHIEQRRRLADEILQAVDNGDFRPVYQPQVDLESGAVVALEALARWHHPDQGQLAPEKFLAIADEMGLVDQIDRQILAQASEDLGIWQASGLEIPRLAVNVSARRLFSTRLFDELRGLDLPAGALAFEVLEEVCLDGQNPTLSWNLDALRDLGIDLELDDFGTRRAAASSILSLRPARIKVARQLVHASIGTGPERPLLEAVTALGHTFQVPLTANGVETEAQRAALARMGFARVQGFAIAAPMPASNVPDWLRTAPATAI